MAKRKPVAPAPKRVAVVGSRTFPQLVLVKRYVERLFAKYPDAIVVSGAAQGVDRVAENAARHLGMATDIYPADWNTHGLAAGPIRNGVMLDNSDIVVAFIVDGSRGTADMIRQAEKRGFKHGENLFVYGPHRSEQPAPVTAAEDPSFDVAIEV
jgi:hypothetical protein